MDRKTHGACGKHRSRVLAPLARHVRERVKAFEALAMPTRLAVKVAARITAAAPRNRERPPHRLAIALADQMALCACGSLLAARAGSRTCGSRACRRRPARRWAAYTIGAAEMESWAMRRAA